MDKEKIFEELKSRIGETSLSDRTLMSWVEQNLPADGAEPDEAYWNKHVALMKSLGGQYNHDVADFVSKHQSGPTPAPQPQPDPTPAPAADDEVKKMLESLRKQNEALAKRMDAEQSERERAATLSRVRERMLMEGCDRDYVLDNVLRDAVVDGKKPFDDLVTELLAKYDTEYAKAYGNGAAPRNGGGGAGGGKTAVDAYFDKKWKKKDE